MSNPAKGRIIADLRQLLSQAWAQARAEERAGVITLVEDLATEFGVESFPFADRIISEIRKRGEK